MNHTVNTGPGIEQSFSCATANYSTANTPTPTGRATMSDVTDHHDIAQAAHLRAELWRHVEEISQRLEQTERRERRLSDWSHRHSRQMRAELYQTHHLIDALDRRFPPHAHLEK